MSKKSCPDEYPITLYVNGQNLATYQLTNQDLEDWAIGYLYSEAIIGTPGDLKSIKMDESRGRILVEITNDFNIEQFREKQMNFSAGCGRGITFFSMSDVKSFPKVKTNRTVSLSYLLKKRHEFAINSSLYLETGGMHGACIIDREGNVYIREDIGRHNAVDKIIGFALRQNMNPEDLILLTTGRISYEMLSKAARFGFGIVGSRTAATKQAIQLANYLNVEVIGYIRGKMINVYTSCGRVLKDLNDMAAGQH